jgi:hypothetical protein
MSKTPQDRDTSGFMIRLSELFRPKLQLLKEKLRQPMTALVQLALKTLFARFRPVALTVELELASRSA